MPFTYAIADLHGCYDLLSEALTKIVEHSKSERPATIVTLADYVDRGPKSRQVIERLMDWGPRWQTFTPPLSALPMS
jgi:serine/threonine protein phosphatase 1